MKMLWTSLSTWLTATTLTLGALTAADHGDFGLLSRQNVRRAELLVRNNADKKPSLYVEEDLRFLNVNTTRYRVDYLPDVNFDVGEMYSGLIPIDTKNNSRALFFVFQPTIGEPVDEITIWFNGGPGCSSLDGFFHENGRFLWQPGTFAPVENPYSWVNLTNMLWVEYPVGTGFSIGDITAMDQEETAQDFVDFFRNFQELFGIKNFKIYVTGESYAGRYVPYVSSAIIDQKDKTYFDLRGAITYDPCIGDFNYVQEAAVAVPFVKANSNLFRFNETFMELLDHLDKSCGYADFRKKYYRFPPSREQPQKYLNVTAEPECDVFGLINLVALSQNPCFDPYEITSQCPILWDVLSLPTSFPYTPEGATTYFNRTDVKKAMHAPDIDWKVCGENTVFVGEDGAGPEGEGDLSLDPIQHVLPKVIEATNRVLVGNGDLDMIIITNGTLMSIQNMTWNGKLGFQEKPSTPIDIQLPDLQYQALFEEDDIAALDGPQGIQGIQHFERGLMWVESFMSGHMQPEFQPRVAYRHLEWLLGRTERI